MKCAPINRLEEGVTRYVDSTLMCAETVIWLWVEQDGDQMFSLGSKVLREKWLRLEDQ